MAVLWDLKAEEKMPKNKKMPKLNFFIDINHQKLAPFQWIYDQITIHFLERDFSHVKGFVFGLYT